VVLTVLQLLFFAVAAKKVSNGVNRTWRGF
jgi:hypothetical protein